MLQLNREDILLQEKLSLRLFMMHRKYLTVSQSAGKLKNTFDSETVRKAGNELYKKRPHNSGIHENIWNYYTQSIAFAPNNSEDLAQGYGNRSALFFHIKKYKECIIDIDRALSITCSNLLKVKLLCRKAESLMMLNESTMSVCEEALRILEQLKESEKKVYTEKLNGLLVTKTATKSVIKSYEKDSIIKDLLNFEHSKEIPSVSKSVAIKYDKKYGRHVVATEDIKPGEIISVQQCCCTFISPCKMYLYCSYCTVIAYNSLPCEFCMHDIYCSEECRSKSWEEYHQYECVLYQHSTIFGKGILYIKFVLSAIHQVGSIEQMKDHILEIENTIDPRTKGFSNGIFYAEQKKNFYSLSKYSTENFVLDKSKHYFLIDICNYVYILAKFTNFFGSNTNVQESEVLLNEDRLFIAALILRTGLIFQENKEEFQVLGTPITTGETNFYVELFSSLINHNCHSNVISLRINGGKNIIYARFPIRKGSQLFRQYSGIHCSIPKSLREELLDHYEITCECIACLENWSTISIPSIEQLLEITPTLDVSIIEMNRKLLNQIQCKIFTKDLFNQVCHHLAELAEKFTVLCTDYYNFLKFTMDFIHQIFSDSYYDMPEKCE